MRCAVEVFSSSHAGWWRFLAAHRAQAPRRRRLRADDRVLILAREQTVLRWIEHELFAERVTLQIVASFADVVATLTLVPPPWPHLLILDVEAVTSSEAELFDGIRDAG